MPLDRSKVHSLLLLLQEAVEPSPVARRTRGVQAEARRSGEAGEADRGQFVQNPGSYATTPQPQLPEAVRHCAAVCCRRAAVAAVAQAVAAEAKTRHNWRSVMTQIATKYVADPHKYGDGSGYGGR